MKLIIAVLLTMVGFVVGRILEAKHYKSIKASEKELLYLPILNINKDTLDDNEIDKTQMVYGSVVISIDYFKRFLAGLRKIFGGEISSYETLIDRARREAILRMKEMAASMQADVITNMRVETSIIGKRANKGGVGSVELLAYGNGITIRK